MLAALSAGPKRVASKYRIDTCQEPCACNCRHRFGVRVMDSATSKKHTSRRRWSCKQDSRKQIRSSSSGGCLPEAS
eukprot:1675457-Amphidinium_carterae.2